MIEVTIKFKGGKHELARITMENIEPGADTDFGDYSIRFAVDTAEGIAIYQRKVENFPRTKLNALALLRIALETLTEEELSLDANPDARHSSSVARRFPGFVWPF